MHHLWEAVTLTGNADIRLNIYTILFLIYRYLNGTVLFKTEHLHNADDSEYDDDDNNDNTKKKRSNYTNNNINTNKVLI